MHIGLIIALSIIAFFSLLGLLGFFIWRSQVKKRMDSRPTNNIELTNHIKFDIDKLIELLGGIQNIVSHEANLNKYKIYFKDRKVIQVDKIKNLIADTIVESSNYLIIVLGNMTSKTYNHVESQLKKRQKHIDKEERKEQA